MFSGKSSKLIKRIQMAKVLFGDKILIINHTNDNRYTTESDICSHNKESVPSVSVKSLSPLTDTIKYHESKAIFIDEAQFFDDLYDFTITALNHNKLVVVCGLDGDYERKPFGQILSLIPLSDSVCKLSALCNRCNNGTSAIFSKRIGNGSAQILIGSVEEYEPVCRYHYS